MSERGEGERENMTGREWMRECGKGEKGAAGKLNLEPSVKNLMV